MKVWRAENNYGLELQVISFDDITWGGVPCKELPGMAKFKRYYELLEQEKLMHPLLLKGRELWNGGLRLRVGLEKGYDAIECYISDDIEELKKLTIAQQSDAHNHFTRDALEPLESMHII